MTATRAAKTVRGLAAAVLVLFGGATAAGAVADHLASTATPACPRVRDSTGLVSSEQLTTLTRAATQPGLAPVLVRVQAAHAGTAVQQAADRLAARCLASAPGVVLVVQVDDGALASSAAPELRTRLAAAWPRIAARHTQPPLRPPADVALATASALAHDVPLPPRWQQARTAARHHPMQVSAGGAAGAGTITAALFGVSLFAGARRARWARRVDAVDLAAVRRDQVAGSVTDLRRVLDTAAWQGSEGGALRGALLRATAAVCAVDAVVGSQPHRAGVAIGQVLPAVDVLLRAAAAQDAPSVQAAAVELEITAEPWLRAQRDAP